MTTEETMTGAAYLGLFDVHIDTPGVGHHDRDDFTLIAYPVIAEDSIYTPEELVELEAMGEPNRYYHGTDMDTQLASISIVMPPDTTEWFYGNELPTEWMEMQVIGDSIDCGGYALPSFVQAHLPAFLTLAVAAQDRLRAASHPTYAKVID